jgi:alcohol dehydrogenase (cytochrome c)
MTINLWRRHGSPRSPPWGEKLSGAIHGGVTTCTANGLQKVAVATGFISPVWPVPTATVKVAIVGVEGDATSR